MKKYVMMMLVLFTSTLYAQVKETGNTNKKITIDENIEWTDTWIASTQKHDLPKVLLIGDSHVKGYYASLANLLKDSAYVSRFCTSKSFGDPVYMDQLTWFLKSYQFDIITINNGLHGIAYSLDQYAKDIPTVYNLIRNLQPNAHLIWVNTTARRKANLLDETALLNQQVIERNASVEAFCKEKKIPLVDAYAASIAHPEYYVTDGIHFNKEGVAKETEALKAAVQQLFKK